MAPKKKLKTEAAPKEAAKATPAVDKVGVVGETQEVKEDKVQVEIKEDKVEDVEMKTEVKLEDVKDEDAVADRRKRMDMPVRFLLGDTTPGVMPSTTGGMLLAIKDGGLQHFCAGARASVGVKSGRYAFEVKVVETLSPVDPPQAKQQGVPKSLLRVGFSTAGSSLILGGDGCDEDANIAFDETGSMMLSSDCSIVLVLNLDNKSKNFNTVSLFHDGERVGAPHALPDCLKGKALYPTVTFKNATVHTNFATDLSPSLPFKCRMLDDAAVNDVVVTEDKSDELEVVFPVFLPDKGTFDYIDWFQKQNPSKYVELSDRAVHEWAINSGLTAFRKPTANNSKDRPDSGFNIPNIDNGTVKKTIASLSHVQPRSHIVMDVLGNLLAKERAKALKKWEFAPYKKVAQVMLGKPEEGFRQKVLEMLLAEKQLKLDNEFVIQQAEKKRKKAAEAKRKQLQKHTEKMEKVRKAAIAKVQKKRAQEAAAALKAAKAEAEAEAKAAAIAEAEASGEPVPEDAAGAEAKPDDEAKEEEEEDVKEEEEEEDEKMEEEEPEKEEEEEVEDTPPKATLTAVEKNQWFVTHALSDLSQTVANTNFKNFSIPTEEEGFDEIRYVWGSEKESAEELRQWLVERKLVTRIEDLLPSDWFHGKYQEWQQELNKWHKTHMEFKDPSKKQGGGGPPKMSPPKMSPPTLGDMMKDDKPAREGDEDKDPMQLLEEELDREEIDIFAVKDANDMDGEGTPLFSNFAFEDWALLSLRFELHLLVHAFRRDANDAERIGVHPEHVAFYYNKYYKKALSPKNYGVGTVDELLELVMDTVVWDVKSKVVESMVSDDLETNGIFVKLTEESRRDRYRRVDAGEEAAKLKFSRPTGGLGANNMLSAAPTSGGGTGNMNLGGGIRPAGQLGQRMKAAGIVPKQQGWNGGGFQQAGMLRPALRAPVAASGLSSMQQRAQQMMQGGWNMNNQFQGGAWGGQNRWAP